MSADGQMAAVVVNYNYADFVGDAIDSVLAQHEAFSEVVVVDDGSTDGSVELIRRFGPGVRLVTKHNGGQLSACLAGYRATTAPYVYFLDADDTVSPDMTRVVRNHLATGPAKVQFPLRAVDAAGQPTGSVFPTVPTGYDAAQMRDDNATQGFYTCSPTSGNVYSRTFIDGLHVELLDPRETSDGPLALAAPHRGEVVALNTPLANYRIHGRNQSQWFAPTPALLQWEIDRFHRRWEQTCAALEWSEPPHGTDEPGFVRERRLMLAALKHRPWVGAEAIAYVRALLRSHLPRPQRAVLTLWAVSMLVPSGVLRARLVTSRRSPAARPEVVRRAVRLIRHATVRA
jgi:hypothetical protein